MKTPRYDHCAFAFDSSIYVCGGVDRDNNMLSSVEQFSVNDSRGWIELPKMKQKRFSFNSNFFVYYFFIRLYNSPDKLNI